MRKFGVAIVGLGPASLPHAKSLIDLNERVEVRWAIGRSEQSTRGFAKQFPFPVSRSILDALNDPIVDAVFVLTPPNAHLEIAAAAFAAGKHVLLEKPLDTTLVRAERVVAVSHTSGKRLGVVLQHRFRPASIRLNEILAAGEIGTIEAASLSVPWWRPQSYYDVGGRGSFARDGGGVLITQAIHALDLFRMLLGVSNVVAARVRTTSLHKMEAEDHVTALLTLANGAPASLLATTAAYPGFPETLDIVGSSATASLIGGTLKVAYHNGREEIIQSEGKSGSGAAIMDFPHHAHRALITDFLDAIGDDRDPRVNGEEALATQRFIANIIRADPTNRQPV
jgi:predicted dehydrogenase